MAMNRREMLKRSAAAAVGLNVPSFVAAQETLSKKVARYVSETKEGKGIEKYDQESYRGLLAIPDIRGNLPPSSAYTETTAKLNADSFTATITATIYHKTYEKNYDDPRNTLTVDFRPKTLTARGSIIFTDEGLDDIVDSGLIVAPNGEIQKSPEPVLRQLESFYQNLSRK